MTRHYRTSLVATDSDRVFANSFIADTKNVLFFVVRHTPASKLGMQRFALTMAVKSVQSPFVVHLEWRPDAGRWLTFLDALGKFLGGCPK